MKKLHTATFGTRFHIPKSQPIKDKIVIKVTRKGGVTEEQFANDIKEFVMMRDKSYNKKVEFRVVG